MASIQMHDNDFVTVSYSSSGTNLSVTLEEFNLIQKNDKISMIKFIEEKYKIGLCDAKKVVETICDIPY